MVWYPSLLSTALLGAAFWFFNRNQEGLSLGYLYVGAIIPAALLLLRQALDFTYKEELLMNTLADYDGTGAYLGGRNPGTCESG